MSDKEFTLNDLEKYFQELVAADDERRKHRLNMFEESSNAFIATVSRICKEKGISEAEFWGFKKLSPK